MSAELEKSLPENYAILRHIALNIIPRATSIDASIKLKRHMTALNDNVCTPPYKRINLKRSCHDNIFRLS